MGKKVKPPELKTVEQDNNGRNNNNKKKNKEYAKHLIHNTIF